MYGSPIALINHPPSSCEKIGEDQKLKISLKCYLRCIDFLGININIVGEVVKAPTN